MRENKLRLGAITTYLLMKELYILYISETIYCEIKLPI